MKYLKHIFLLLLLPFMVTTTLSNPLDKFVHSFNEQEALVGWVKSNSQVDISEQKALSIIREVYSQAYSKNINPHILLAMIKSESGFRANARSSEGAKGLLQVIPRWHKDKLAGRDPYSPKVSIEVGSQVYLDCLRKHNSNTFKTLNCYSGGGGHKYFKTISKNHSSVKSYVMESRSNRILLASN